MVKQTTATCELDGTKYRRTTYERDGVPASRMSHYQVRCVHGYWRYLPSRAVKIRARIDATLDNPQTSG